jgi:hypothetical protein
MLTPISLRKRGRELRLARDRVGGNPARDWDRDDAAS